MTDDPKRTTRMVTNYRTPETKVRGASGKPTKRELADLAKGKGKRKPKRGGRNADQS